MKRTAPLVGRLVAVVALAAAMGVAGVPMPAAVLLAAGIGGVLVARHLVSAREVGVEQRLPGALDTFEVSLACDRVAVGRLVQIRLLPPTRSVWAPGMLGVSRGALTFVPAKAKHAVRAWSGPVERVEVHSLPSPASVVRAHGPSGSAQFVVHTPADQVQQALAPHLNLVVG